MTELPLLTDDVLDPVSMVNEYRALCEETGCVEGTSLRAMRDHAWREGAQFRELTPDMLDRPGSVFLYLRHRGS